MDEPAKRGDRRGDLMEAARQVFTDKGYAKTRIADIAEAARVAKGTFYLYFQTKQEIFHALVDELFATLRQAHQGILSLDPRTLRDPEVFAQAVEPIIRAQRENLALVTLVEYEAFTPGGEIGARCRALSAEIIAAMQSYIARGIAAGVFRPIDPTVAALVINYAGERLVRSAELSLCPLPSEEETRRSLHTVLFRGLLADES